MRTFPMKQVVELVAGPLKTTGRQLHLVANLSSSRKENILFNASWKRPCMPRGDRPRAPEDEEVPEQDKRNDDETDKRCDPTAYPIVR